MEWVRFFFETIRDRIALAEALIVQGDLPRAWKFLKEAIQLNTRMTERFDNLSRKIPAVSNFSDAITFRAGEDSVFVHSREVEAQFEAALVPVQK